MKSKIVTYDLIGDNQDYESLIAKIQLYRYWTKLTESCWVIKTTISCSDVQKDLASVMGDDDRLFVAELTGVAAWQNVICHNL